jgi:hypothetical protein
VVSILLVTVFYVNAYPLSSSDPEVVNALNYLRNAQKTDGSIENFVTSSWAVMAVAATGENLHTWRNGGPSIVEYLKANKDLLDPGKATDVARYILSMSAAGEDPRNITGTDYVAILESLYANGQIGDEDLLNDDFWGILGLVSAKTANTTIVQDSMNFIRSNQNANGGWNWAVGGTSDVDDTAAAIMALIAANESASSTVIVDALSYIKSKQMDNGGFESWGATNPGTDSWAIDAIVAAGQDPTSMNWMKNGKTPVDDLLNFQGGDGAFSFPGPNPDKEWATSYAIPALVGKPYPIRAPASPDLNDDGIVNILDAIILAGAFGSEPGDQNWNVVADINQDGSVNILDAIILAGYFGEIA